MNDKLLPQSITAKWQRLIDLYCKSLELPTCVIKQLESDKLEILLKNNSNYNLFEGSNYIKNTDSYCTKVVCNKSVLLVPNIQIETNKKKESNKPIVNTYLGYPIFMPDGSIFGTISILDCKENSFTKEIENLLSHIRKIIELDLASYFSYDQKSIALEEKIVEQFKKLEKVKSELIDERNDTKGLKNQIKTLNKQLINIESKHSRLVSKMSTAAVIFSPIWSKDGNLIDAIYMDMNPVNEEIIGYSKEEVLGKSIKEVFPETEMGWFKKFEAVCNHGETVNFSLYHKELNKHFLANSFPIEGELFCVLYSDISNYLNLEQQLEEKELFYSSIFNATKTAIVIFEPITDNKGKLIDLRYLDMNNQNDSYINMPRESIIGKTILEIFPETKDEFLDHFRLSLTNQKINTFEDYHAPLDSYFTGMVFQLNDKLIFACNDNSKRIKAMRVLQDNEERFRSLFDKSTSAMLLMEPITGKFIDANKTVLSFIGYTKEEILKMHPAQICMSNKKEIEQRLSTTKENHNNYFETQFKTSNGTIKDVEIYSSLLEYKQKQVFHLIIHDITDKKHHLKEIIKLSQAVTQAPASIVITDLNGNITYSNPKNCKITGHEENELIGQNPRVLKSGKMSMDVYKEMWAKIKKGGKWEGEFYNKRKDGSFYWEQATIAAIKDDKGKILSYIKVGKDITKQRKLQKDLYKAKIKAEESDRLKTAFLANLSHEVRTPLNSILGFSDLLLSEDSKEESKPMYSSIIHKAGEQLLMIISDIVKISQIEAGQLSIKLSYFLLTDLFEEIKSTHEIEIKEKGLHFEMYCSSCINSEIKADRKRIRQIIDNLIKNAIKFTDEGVISLHAEYKNDHILFKVRDTGIGISRENQDIIFERFRQIEEHYTRNYGGNGLGLSISKEIIELMGGKIWLNSEAGKGSVFYFTVPIYATTNNLQYKMGL